MVWYREAVDVVNPAMRSAEEIRRSRKIGETIGQLVQPSSSNILKLSQRGQLISFPKHVEQYILESIGNQVQRSTEDNNGYNKGP